MTDLSRYRLLKQVAAMEVEEPLPSDEFVNSEFVIRELAREIQDLRERVSTLESA